MSSKESGSRGCAESANLQRLLSAMQNPGPMNYSTLTKSRASTAATNWRNYLSEPLSESSSPSLSEAESVALQMFDACLTPEQTRLLSILLRYGDLILSMKSQDVTETNVSWSLSRRSEPSTDGKPIPTAEESEAELMRSLGQDERLRVAPVNSSSPVSTKTEP